MVDKGSVTYPQPHPSAHSGRWGLGGREEMKILWRNIKMYQNAIKRHEHQIKICQSDIECWQGAIKWYQRWIKRCQQWNEKYQNKTELYRRWIKQCQGKIELYQDEVKGCKDVIKRHQRWITELQRQLHPTQPRSTPRQSKENDTDDQST